MTWKAIFFDAAGTLIRPVEPVGAVYARLAARHGLEASADAMNAAFRAAWKATPSPLHPEGQPPADDDRAWWRQVATQSFQIALGKAVPDEIMEPLFAELYAHYALPEAWHVFDDVRPVLEDLAADHALHVLSNFDRRLLSILDGHGLRPLFGKIILSSEVGASKPHARMFTAALRAAQAEPAECLHVGDEPTADAAGATAAGMRCFIVDRPTSGFEMLKAWVRRQE
jgi:putative hydrolase of the HAD superfamily